MVAAAGGAAWWGAAPARAAGTVSITLDWTKTVGGRIMFSSPDVATLDGSGPSVVVGAEDGHLYAFHVADGSAPAGWAGGVPLDTNIDSTPSVWPDGHGTDTVYVGTGNVANPAPGKYVAVHADGTVAWSFTGTPTVSEGSVLTSLALAPLTCAGTLDAVSGSTGLGSFAVDASNGSPLPGWPVRNYDTVWSSPSVVPVGGQNIVVEGDDSTSPNGGWLRAMSGSGQTLWQDQFDDVTTSSPAVGVIDSSGRPRAVVGHGNYWAQTTNTATSSSTELTVADAATGTILWNKTLSGYTQDSPALADVAGTGTSDIVIGIHGSPTNPNYGAVHVLDGNGNPLPNWPRQTPAGWGAVYGGVTTADLTGSGYQDILVPTGAGLAIYDGRSAQVIATAGNESNANLALQNSALVTTDPNGKLGITIAGQNTTTGAYEVRHYTVASSATTPGPGSWPQFHHDPAQTGSAVAPVAHPTGCGSVQAGGYRMVASDGGIFDFGNAAFYGSEGGSPGASPVVGMAPTPDGHGYWIASADGTVRAYGDAAFHGDQAGSGARMVGIRPTPDGAGYWLVDSYGGVYTFGTAGYYGNGEQPSQDAVGMAPTPDGHGYWIVTDTGRVIACGDAAALGDTSTMSLNAPVLGVAPTGSGHGYWIIAQDGGIFSFGDAVFHGSTGSMHLNAPVVGMTPTPTGAGYWLVASDGGIFTFGDAQFYGSMGGQRLNAPVIAMTSGG